ncbi:MULTISPECIES: ABC transporter substrate-binding protein [Glycomyces]|uniref:Iron complex transport system substrate-binding protein n=2 Tax=Glycomyces TaxID=58113 RepID=A0A9X3PFL4_9ACTN|nr:iron-siderophore ABC transporter substrate-binding protein [Glycomyces lechevalierae]MDA1384639.1 iron-siderophore ABC transporter substrate-binding protein [Glycomyces lechevalierae]MDR7337908.1 iron complex transport system substrate-binding protein [Glycomyces lechevalierae]
MRLPHLQRSAVPAALAAAALLALSACGTTEEGGGDDGTEAASGPVSTVDFLGRTVELDKPAERVVILEWSEVEISISLGVMPVGVADIEGYNVWAGAAEPLDDSVTDVGMRSEASIDSIAGLNPDLVILENDNEAIIDPLEEFVPVLVTEGSNEEDNLARMQRDVNMIADLTGKNAEADELWAAFETKLADTAAAIEAGGKSDVPVLIVDGWIDGSSISIRPFGEGSLFGALAKEVGLTNAWTGETDGVWGGGATDVEGLAQYTDTELNLVYNNSFNDDIFNEALVGNPIYDNLRFVKDGTMYELPKGAWTFGGPRSSEILLDFLAEVYAS